VSPDAVLHRLRALGLVAVVRGESRAAAREVASALVEGGVLGIEITFTTPDADGVIADLAAYGEDILLGAGTVTSAEQAQAAAAAGARFLVSPGLEPALLEAMRATGLAVLPGVLTPSEVMLAVRHGVRVLKLFPGSAGGPSHLRALLGPFPELAFVPTGGVSVGNVGEWFDAGAVAVGVGGALAPARVQDRDALVARARELVAAVAEARA